MNSTEVLKALDKARQLAEIASDWNLDEVEIDGEMVDTLALAQDFQALLDRLNAPQPASPVQPVPVPDWSQVAANHHDVEVFQLTNEVVNIVHRVGDGSRAYTPQRAYKLVQSLVYGLLKAQDEYGDTTLTQRPATDGAGEE